MLARDAEEGIDAFLAKRGVLVRETVRASSKKFGAGDLKALFAGATSVVVSRGSKSAALDLRSAPPGSAEFAAAVSGPTGNLRAPAARIGKIWLVGYCEAGWEEILA